MTRVDAAANARMHSVAKLKWKLTKGITWEKGDLTKLAEQIGWSTNRLRHYFNGSTLACDEKMKVIVYGAHQAGVDIIINKAKGK